MAVLSSSPTLWGSRRPRESCSNVIGRGPSCFVLFVFCALLISGCSPDPDGSEDERGLPVKGDDPAAIPAEATSEYWPKTVPEAAEYVLTRLSEENKQALRQMKEEDLIDTHFGLALWIRNNLGPWSGNTELLRATGEGHPDDASHVIVQAVWKRLKTQRATTSPSL